MTTKLRTIIVIVLQIIFFLNVIPAGAAFGISISEPEEINTKILCPIASAMYQILITLSVIIILYATYLYVTASGNAEQITKAHKTLLYAAVAVIVAFIASGAPRIIASIFDATGLPADC